MINAPESNLFATTYVVRCVEGRLKAHRKECTLPEEAMCTKKSQLDREDGINAAPNRVEEAKRYSIAPAD